MLLVAAAAVSLVLFTGVSVRRGDFGIVAIVRGITGSLRSSPRHVADLDSSVDDEDADGDHSRPERKTRLSQTLPLHVAAEQTMAVVRVILFGGRAASAPRTITEPNLPQMESSATRASRLR